jgi:hypothetical protein
MLGGALGIASSRIVLPVLGSVPPPAEEESSLELRQACAEYGLSLQRGADVNPGAEAWCGAGGRIAWAAGRQLPTVALREP